MPARRAWSCSRVASTRRPPSRWRGPEGFDGYALSFDYGQRHDRELESRAGGPAALGAKEHLVLRLDLRAIAARR